jgi:hypothetical protein
MRKRKKEEGGGEIEKKEKRHIVKCYVYFSEPPYTTAPFMNL